jgi:hypothetical protein
VGHRTETPMARLDELCALGASSAPTFHFGTGLRLAPDLMSGFVRFAMILISAQSANKANSFKRDNPAPEFDRCRRCHLVWSLLAFIG